MLRCVVVRDGRVIGSGYNMTNHTRNVSGSGRQAGYAGWPGSLPGGGVWPVLSAKWCVVCGSHSSVRTCAHVQNVQQRCACLAGNMEQELLI
jgi:hypothetical protein